MFKCCKHIAVFPPNGGSIPQFSHKKDSYLRLGRPLGHNMSHIKVRESLARSSYYINIIKHTLGPSSLKVFLPNTKHSRIHKHQAHFLNSPSHFTVLKNNYSWTKQVKTLWEDGKHGRRVRYFHEGKKETVICV